MPRSLEAHTRLTALLGLLSLTGCGPADPPAMGRSPTPGRATLQQPVVSGRLATANDLLSTVALTDPNGDEAECTGTLIAPRLVLTAAHCLVDQDEDTDEIIGVRQPAELGVVVGAVRVPDAESVYAVAQIVVHPGYPGEGDSTHPTGAGREDDIALLVLEAEVTELPWVEIPDAAMALDALEAGTTLTLSGYGATGPDQDDSGVLHIGEAPFEALVDAEIIVGGPGEADTCPGDSGGPVYLLDDGEPWLLGVTSRGVDTSDATCGDGGIYAFAPTYRDWITANAAGLYPPAGEPGDACDAADCGGVPGEAPGDPAPDEDDDEDDAGCSVAADRPSPAAWLAGLMLLTLRARRRRQCR